MMKLHEHNSNTRLYSLVPRERRPCFRGSVRGATFIFYRRLWDEFRLSRMHPCLRVVSWAWLQLLYDATKTHCFGLYISAGQEI
ncbi:hypothetical protein O3P69_003711 [Scylla paramamosain]|uniref:Uncharacterized protein n=1 Tax=Scylla paramamosain TaxID=85552 RepID=A0AAW0UGK6_SCYPA